ncbi:MAG: hypothetical protein MZU91_13590 [Desulfosudis oleivorans]|nr:hypothetical protein [Desulfosudis oleivorans]
MHDVAAADDHDPFRTQRAQLACQIIVELRRLREVDAQLESQACRPPGRDAAKPSRRRGPGPGGGRPGRPGSLREVGGTVRLPGRPRRRIGDAEEIGVKRPEVVDRFRAVRVADTATPLRLSQWADTTRMASGRGKFAPARASAAVKSLRWMAFSGWPWPMKRTGIMVGRTPP